MNESIIFYYKITTRNSVLRQKLEGRTLPTRILLCIGLQGGGAFSGWTSKSAGPFPFLFTTVAETEASKPSASA